VWFGLVCALFAAICYGVASTVQAVAAREATDDRRGVDPRLLFRLLGQWRYLSSIALDVLGFVGQITALRSLPLFVVQATMAASIVVTALVAIRWFDMRLSRPEWASVAVVCVGLAMLGASAQSEGADHVQRAFHFGLLAVAVLLGGVGVAAGQLPDPARTAVLGLVSGLGFGVVGVSVRVLPSMSPAALVGDPATYALIVGGVLASWLYASAMQRGGVVAATAMMLVGETVPASVIGVVLLGDHTRPGWAPVAVVGFVVAVAGALVLARFGEVGPTTTPADSPGADSPGDGTPATVGSDR
jgi:drug/metabolite transporter (DMT)-like permease